MSDTARAAGTRPAREADLQDALQELISSGDQPDAEALEKIVARYPRYAAELTDFAVEWALQELLPETAGEDHGGSAVPAAMDRFRARLAELEAGGGTPASPRVGGAAAAAEPFADRSPAELKRLAATLGLDKTLVAKLRDRKIVAETVPAELREELATELEVPAAAVAAHLALPAVVHAGASFKAAGKPEAGAKETFSEAVRRSSLATREKARWLACRAETTSSGFSSPSGAGPATDPDHD